MLVKMLLVIFVGSSLLFKAFTHEHKRVRFAVGPLVPWSNCYPSRLSNFAVSRDSQETLMLRGMSKNASVCPVRAVPRYASVCTIRLSSMIMSLPYFCSLGLADGDVAPLGFAYVVGWYLRFD